MNRLSWQKQALGLLGWLALSFAVSFIGALASFQAQSFYGLLSQPAWAPPPWLFGPVWTLLYAMMAVSAWLVWRQRINKSVVLPLCCYIVQLTVNGLWSWFFFGQQWIGVALVDLLLLVLLVVIAMVLFFRSNRKAGFLLIPYLLWISFAAALNFQIWILN